MYPISRLVGLRVLAFHAVRDLAGTSLESYGIPKEEFAEVIGTLAKTFKFLDPADLFSDSIPENLDRTLLITFDDCYDDIVDAFEILEEYSAKALVFPVSSLMGKFNEWDRAPAPELPLLSAEKLKGLVNAGWLVGSHTVSHRELPGLDGPLIRQEIRDSIAALDREGLGCVMALAYPFGRHNGKTVDAAAEAGIRLAFTTESGIITRQTNPLAIPRIEVMRGERGAAVLAKIEKAGSDGMQTGVTATILSCGRFDLLRLTVESTFRAISGRIDQVIVAEDSGLPDATAQLEEIFRPWNVPTQFIIHDLRKGIAASMDELYRSVTTPYIFHLEDDWVCTATQADFIERSIDILKSDPNIFQVWLRPPHDCNGHPLEDGIFEAGPATFRIFKTCFEGIWHGYSNNPNVRRTKDYGLLPGGFAAFETGGSGATEARIGEFYFRRRFVAAVLSDPDGGFIHIGTTRSIDGHQYRTPPNMAKRFDALRRRAVEMRKELEALRGKADDESD